MGWIDEKRLPNGLLRPLTRRQGEVVSLLATGLDLQPVADALEISYDVVAKHVQAIAALLPNPRRLRPLALVRTWAIAQEYNRQGRADAVDELDTPKL